MIITREERMRANFEAVREYELSESRKQGIEQGIEKGIEQGIEQGIEKGFAQGLMQTARNMLLNNFDVDVIAQMTGLSVEEIESIATQ